MEQFINLNDKTILITGASVGIGFETAVCLERMGAKLVLHASKDESIAILKANFDNNRHLFFKADFSNPEELEAEFKKLPLQDIKFDGYVNCVGMRSRKPIHLLKANHTMQVLNANVTAFLEMVRLITKKQQYNPGLSIVSISSVSSMVGGPGVAVYAASKAAVDAAIRCLAKELYKKEIRINSVISGQVNTLAYRELMESKADAHDPVLDKQYLGLGSANDVANVVLFLLSTKSAFITGASVPADGGFLT